MAERNQSLMDFLRVQDGDNPADIAFLFESPRTFVDGGDGLMKFEGDLFVSAVDPSVCSKLKIFRSTSSY